jgi:hypothetical protein
MSSSIGIGFALQCGNDPTRLPSWAPYPMLISLLCGIIWPMMLGAVIGDRIPEIVKKNVALSSKNGTTPTNNSSAS